MNENNENIVVDTPKGTKRKGDILAFILCFVVGFMLWGYVMGMESPTSERTFNGVKVDINNIDKLGEQNNLSIVSENTHLVIDVVLQGKKSALSKLNSDDIKAYIDVGNITESGTFSLDIRYMAFPEGITFAGASSNVISMKFDTKTQIEVPIVVKYENCIIPEGYSAGDYVLSTDTLTVEGAKADLEKIHQAVITISTGILTKSITVMDAVPVICDKNGKQIVSDYIEHDATYVNVKVPVYLQKDIILDYDLVYDLYNQSNTVITLSPSVLTVYGEATVVENLSDRYTVANINEKKNQDNFKVTVDKGWFGSDVEIVSETNEIAVSVTHKKTSVTQLHFLPENVKVNNPHGLKYVLPEDGFVVNFRCSDDKLSFVDTLNVIPVLDLSSVGAAEDSTDVIVTFNYSDDVRGYMYELGTYSIEVDFSQSGQ